MGTTRYGQLVIGPPGSGKTTYCNAMQQFLRGLGRKVAVINIDPANDRLPYECAVEISELITLEDAMREFDLGPNGGLVYCMEYLEANVDWLQERLDSTAREADYILFDCPGQVELYTHNRSVHNIVEALVRKRDFRLCCVHLVDVHHCMDPGNFVAALLTSLSAMLQVELPHVNVLTKTDLIQKDDRLHFDLDFYTEVLDLEYLLRQLSDHPFITKYKKLNQELASVIEGYGLVSFVPLHVEDKTLMLRAVELVDKAIGYVSHAGF